MVNLLASFRSCKTTPVPWPDLAVKSHAITSDRRSSGSSLAGYSAAMANAAGDQATAHTTAVDKTQRPRADNERWA